MHQDPSVLVGLLVGVELASQLPQMLAGMIHIHDLGRLGEVCLGLVPDPPIHPPSPLALGRGSHRASKLPDTGACQTLPPFQGHLPRWSSRDPEWHSLLRPRWSGNHTSQFDLPGVGWLSCRFAGTSQRFLLHHRHTRPSICTYRIGIGSPLTSGKSNCMPLWISACSRRAISSPIASAVRSTALVVTSKLARSFICCRP